MFQLYTGDCLDFLKTCGNYDAIFMDPPDGIGYEYDGFEDKREDYRSWLKSVVGLCVQRAPVVWLTYNVIHDFWLKGWLDEVFGEGMELRAMVWRFKFGENQWADFGVGWRPIVRISQRTAVWPHMHQIRVPSERMIKGDLRITEVSGRVPDDVFEFPRVCGNFRERRPWHSTQIPELVVERCLRSCVRVGEGRILDPFMGSGTTYRVCFRNRWHCDGCEISPVYSEFLKREHGIA